jgi:hypothetical protein
LIIITEEEVIHDIYAKKHPLPDKKPRDDVLSKQVIQI